MMNGQDFQKLYKELHQLLESVKIVSSVRSLKFAVEGDIGAGSVEIMNNNYNTTGFILFHQKVGNV